MKLIFLDTESTGNDILKDRLCQVCYKIGSGNCICEYFLPPLPMSVKSMSITHITNKMLEGKGPFSESKMKKELQALLDEGVLVAHNAKFDKAMLEAEGMLIPRFICTLRMARYIDTKNIIPEYNLQFLRYYLGLEIEGNAHDAEGDVLVLEGVFNRLLAKFKEMNPTLGDEEIINKMTEISSTPSLFVKFNFGKHKDREVAEVAKADRGYLEWLLKEKLQSSPDDEDWIYTLKYYLTK